MGNKDSENTAPENNRPSSEKDTRYLKNQSRTVYSRFKKVKYFKAILPDGHVGAGKYKETKFFAKGEDTMSVLYQLRSLPGIKHSLKAPFSIKEITKEQYQKFRDRKIKKFRHFVKPSINSNKD